MNPEKLYSNAIRLSRENNQTVGEKNDYYITIAQLEALLMAERKTNP